MAPHKGRWPAADPDSGIGEAMPLVMEWLAEQGVHAMIRVDPERLAERRPAWTFTASGGPLDLPVRADGDSLETCLTRALAILLDAGLRVPW